MPPSPWLCQPQKKPSAKLYINVLLDKILPDLVQKNSPPVQLFWRYGGRDQFLNQAVNMFISPAKDILMWSNEYDSLLEPDPDGQ